MGKEVMAQLEVNELPTSLRRPETIYGNCTLVKTKGGELKYFHNDELELATTAIREYREALEARNKIVVRVSEYYEPGKIYFHNPTSYDVLLENGQVKLIGPTAGGA